MNFKPDYRRHIKTWMGIKRKYPCNALFDAKKWGLADIKPFGKGRDKGAVLNEVKTSIYEPNSKKQKI